MNRHSTQTHATRRAQRGVTMIELLVSILLFAFGMLGMIGMQNKTLGYAQMSLFRSQATALADDVFDRMRADRVNAKNGNWATEYTDASSSFTGTTIAQTDLQDWKAAVETLLPQGQARIINYTDHIEVDIKWAERSDSNGIVYTEFKTVSTL